MIKLYEFVLEHQNLPASP